MIGGEEYSRQGQKVEWVSLVAQLVKICLQFRRLWFDSWVRKIPQRRERLPIPVFLGFLCGSAGKESTFIVGDLGSIPGTGNSPRRHRLSTPVFSGFPGGSDGKEFTCSEGDLGLIHKLGRSPGGGYGNTDQYSYLENPHGQRTLEGYSPWGHKKLDTIE